MKRSQLLIPFRQLRIMEGEGVKHAKNLWTYVMEALLQVVFMTRGEDKVRQCLWKMIFQTVSSRFIDHLELNAT